MSSIPESSPHKTQACVLLVEDDVVDRLACRRALAQHPQYDFKVLEAETGHQGLHLVIEHHPDFVLLDYHLPDMNGLDFLRELIDEKGETAVPVMMLTGSDNVAVAVEAMRQGACDYLVKDTDRHYLELVSAVVERMLREQQHIKARKDAETRFRTLVEQIPAITYTAAISTPGQLLYISPQLKTLGYGPEEWQAQVGALRNHIHVDDRFRAIEAFDHARVTGQPLSCEYRLRAHNETYRWMHDMATVVHDAAGRPLFLQGVLFDVTQEKEQEEELSQYQYQLEKLVAKRTASLSRANENLRHELTTRSHTKQTLLSEKDCIQVILQSIADAVIVSNDQGTVEFLSPAAQQLTGWTETEAAGQPMERVFKFSEETGGDNMTVSRHARLVRQDGSHVSVAYSTAPILDGNAVSVGSVTVFRILA